MTSELKANTEVMNLPLWENLVTLFASWRIQSNAITIWSYGTLWQPLSLLYSLPTHLSRGEDMSSMILLVPVIPIFLFAGNIATWHGHLTGVYYFLVSACCLILVLVFYPGDTAHVAYQASHFPSGLIYALPLATVMLILYQWFTRPWFSVVSMALLVIAYLLWLWLLSFVGPIGVRGRFWLYSYGDVASFTLLVPWLSLTQYTILRLYPSPK